MTLLKLTISGPLSRGEVLERFLSEAKQAGLETSLGFSETEGDSDLAETIEGVIRPLLGGHVAKTNSDASAITERIDKVLENITSLAEIVEMWMDTFEEEDDSDEEVEVVEEAEEATSVAEPPECLPEPSPTIEDGTESTVLRSGDDGIPRVVEVMGQTWMSPEGFSELLSINPSTPRRWINESGYGKRMFYGDSERTRVFAEPVKLIMWASELKRSPCLRDLGTEEAIEKAVESYHLHGPPHRAVPEQESAKRKTRKNASKIRLTNNSTLQDVMKAAELAGCEVSVKSKKVKINHPSWASPVEMAKNAAHCTPNVFNRINKLTG